MNARRPSLASSLRLLSLIVLVYHCQWMPRGGLCLMHAPGAASYPPAFSRRGFWFRSFRWAAWGVRRPEARPQMGRISMEYVALLRGINVGGKNKVVMSELREQVAGVGYVNVRTYINSGL